MPANYSETALRPEAATDGADERRIEEATAAANKDYGIPNTAATGEDNLFAGAATRANATAERNLAGAARSRILALVLDGFRKASSNIHLEFKELGTVLLRCSENHVSRRVRLVHSLDEQHGRASKDALHEIVPFQDFLHSIRIQGTDPALLRRPPLHKAVEERPGFIAFEAGA